MYYVSYYLSEVDQLEKDTYFPQKETSGVVVAVSELFVDYMKVYKLQ